MHTSILTHTGLLIDLTQPDPARIDLADICHALARIVRYTGHGAQSFTDAQHSVLTCQLAPPDAQRWALLHDAAETYTGDMSGPLKEHLRRLGGSIFRQQFDAWLTSWQQAVSDRFGVPIVDVKQWDDAAALHEVSLNGPYSSDEWFWPKSAGQVLPAHKYVWSVDEAEQTFTYWCDRLAIY